MIRQDEMAPTRSRRRSYYYSIYGADVNGKLDFPAGGCSAPLQTDCIHVFSESLPVGRWAKEYYDPYSPMIAVFMTHAVINNNTTVSFVLTHSSCISIAS